jgi:uncharacterized lipoprotein YmbA
MKITALLALILTTLLTGCVNLKPQPDRSQVFALASDVAAVADLEGKPECYVSRVELPGFLEGTRIYYRSANGKLDSVSGARWAEALAEALPRAIAMHLQATGQANVRGYYPWSQTTRDSPTISVQFERFSANAAGQVEVIAQWQIKFKTGAKREGRYIAPSLVWDRNNVADYVAKLNAALAGLADVIAQEL